MSEIEDTQVKLAEAETAYHKLLIGGQVQSVSLASQYNNRSHTYTQGNIAELRRYINDLKDQIKTLQGSKPRGPVRFMF